MSPRQLFGLAAVLLVQALPTQQLLWQVPPGPPSTVRYFQMRPFPDYDGDGYVEIEVARGEVPS